jgi:hypothetical protein
VRHPDRPAFAITFKARHDNLTTMGKLNPRAKTLDSNPSPGILLHVGLNDIFKAARRKDCSQKKSYQHFFTWLRPLSELIIVVIIFTIAAALTPYTAEPEPSILEARRTQLCVYHFCLLSPFLL